MFLFEYKLTTAARNKLVYVQDKQKAALITEETVPGGLIICKTFFMTQFALFSAVKNSILSSETLHVCTRLECTIVLTFITDSNFHPSLYDYAG